MHVCIQIYVMACNARARVCVCVRVHAFTSVHMYACVCVYKYSKFIYVYVYVCIVCCCFILLCHKFFSPEATAHELALKHATTKNQHPKCLYYFRTNIPEIRAPKAVNHRKP